MNLMYLDTIMYQISGLFLAPVLLLIFVLFLYSLFALGQFLTQQFQRRQGLQQYHHALNALFKGEQAELVRGFPLLNTAIALDSVSQDQLKLKALSALEAPRIITRVAPMLGLIATMIPMGPALKSLADGNVQGISENLVIAFAAVIIGLIIASITYWIAAVSKRWYAAELLDLEPIAVSSQEAEK